MREAYSCRVPRVHSSEKEHGAQKPIDLLSKLINVTTADSSTIFDPFMGSGTTGVACMKFNRNFIGCELDPKYFAIAEKRINAAKMQPALFQVEGPEEKQTKLFEERRADETSDDL